MTGLGGGKTEWLAFPYQGFQEPLLVFLPFHAQPCLCDQPLPVCILTVPFPLSAAWIAGRYAFRPKRCICRRTFSRFQSERLPAARAKDCNPAGICNPCHILICQYIRTKVCHDGE